MDRRDVAAFVAGGLAMAFILSHAKRAWAEDDIADGKLLYRGFTVDISAVLNAANFAAVITSLKHQIDIAADCGAKAEILDFFRGRRITLRPTKGDEPGLFRAGQGVFIDTEPQPPEKPILLHELLHSFHYYFLPGGYHNRDVQMYFAKAKRDRLYPTSEYVLKNPEEFYAVTASLYLWGNVDRAPHIRENLKEQQPYYYAWLGQLFGVQK